MQTPATTLAERLWIERMRLDVSVEEFAALSGVSPRTVREWEDNGGAVPYVCWDAWAKAGVDGEYLDGGLPSQGQLLLLQRELMPAFIERRIEAALAFLPSVQAREIYCKIMARNPGKAAR